MADGELRLTLDDEDLARLRAAAEAAGQPLEAYARDLLIGGAAENRWAESRQRISEYDQTGAYITVEEAMAHFDSELEARLGKRG